MTEVVDIIVRLGGVGALALLIVEFIRKKVTTRRSPAEIRNDRVAELEQARAGDRADLVQMREELVQLKADFSKFRSDARHDIHLLTDYAHDLREQVAEGNPPPPKDWPEGLRL